MDKVSVAAIGLGARGYSVLSGLLLGMNNITLTAVCDLYTDRTEAAADRVESATGVRPFATTDYREILTRADVDAVLIMSDWASHVPVAIDAMKHGKAVGMEVGGAYKLEDCFALVEIWEQTRVPFMFLENCCYGKEEMMVLNMVRQGLFGDVVHCAGGYRHDLRSEIAHGRENRHYRLQNYLTRNAENYPTHELGPIAQILNINRGNQFVSLVSVASCAKGVNDYARRNPDTVDPSLATAKFAQGDVVTTVISCAGGETVTLTLDTTLPRGYSRGFTVQGTRGMYCEDNRSIYLDTDFTEADHWEWTTTQFNNVERYMTAYCHPTWVAYEQNGICGGHGGMDGLVFCEFFECVRTHQPCPIDVYDAAAWMAVTPLSEMSIKQGGSPVPFPDFTHGEWKNRT